MKSKSKHFKVKTTKAGKVIVKVTKTMLNRITKGKA